MMLRRCLVFAALLFWLGGAAFYAAGGIPLGLHTPQPPALHTLVTPAGTPLPHVSWGGRHGAFFGGRTPGPSPWPLGRLRRHAPDPGRARLALPAPRPPDGRPELAVPRPRRAAPVAPAVRRGQRPAMGVRDGLRLPYPLRLESRGGPKGRRA